MSGGLGAVPCVPPCRRVVLALEGVQRTEWSTCTSLFDFIALLCPTATAEEAVMHMHHTQHRGSRARSAEAMLSSGLRPPRRHSSSMSMALLNKRVLAVAPCEARLDHTKTLAAFSAFVPATLPHKGLNVIVVTGEDGRRRYCYAVSLSAHDNDNDQGLILCLSSCFPVLQMARAVLSCLLELVYRPPEGPHCAPALLLDTILRALPPPVPGLTIRLVLPSTSLGNTSLGGGSGGGQRPMFVADCNLTQPTLTHTGVLVEHSWISGGGLPDDGSTQGVLALGLGPRQLVRAWLALLLEIKVVVVSDEARVLLLVCEALLSLLLPLPWPCAYIPAMPPSQGEQQNAASGVRDLLDAPFPALLALSPRQSLLSALAMEGAGVLDECAIVDLDANLVALPPRLLPIAAALEGPLVMAIAGALQGALATRALDMLGHSGGTQGGGERGGLLGAAQRVLWGATMALLTPRMDKGGAITTATTTTTATAGDTAKGGNSNSNNGNGNGNGNGGVLVCGWVKLLSGDGGGEGGSQEDSGRGAEEVVNLWAEMDAFQILLYPRVDCDDTEEEEGGSGHRLLAMPLVRLAMSEVLALTPLPDSEYRDQVFQMHTMGGWVYRLCVLTSQDRCAWLRAFESLNNNKGPAPTPTPASSPHAWLKSQVLSSQGFEVLRGRVSEAACTLSEVDHVISDTIARTLLAGYQQHLSHLTETEGETGTGSQAQGYGSSQAWQVAGAVQLLEAVTQQVQRLRAPGQASLCGRGLEALVRGLDVLLLQARTHACRPQNAHSHMRGGGHSTFTITLPQASNSNNTTQHRPGSIREVIEDVDGLYANEGTSLPEGEALCAAIASLERQQAEAGSERRGPLAHLLSLLYEKQGRPLQALLCVGNGARACSLDRPRIKRLFRSYFRDLANSANTNSQSTPGVHVLLEAVKELGAGAGGEGVTWLGLEGLRYMTVGAASAAAASHALPTHPSLPTAATIKRALSRSSSNHTLHSPHGNGNGSGSRGEASGVPSPSTTPLTPTTATSRASGFFASAFASATTPTSSSTPLTGRSTPTASLFASVSLMRRGSSNLTPTATPTPTQASNFPAPPHPRASLTPVPPCGPAPPYVLLPTDSSSSQLLNGRARWTRLPSSLEQADAMELVATLLDRLTALLRTHGKVKGPTPTPTPTPSTSTRQSPLLPWHECVVLGPSELSELRSGAGYRKEWSVEAGMLQLADLTKAKLLPPMCITPLHNANASALRKTSTGSGRARLAPRASNVADDWEEEEEEEGEEGEEEEEAEEALDRRRLVFLLNLFNLMTAHALIEQHQRLATAAATPVSASVGGSSSSSSSARLLDVLSLQRSARYQLRDVSLTLSMIEHTLLRVSGGLTQVFPVGLGKLLYDNAVDNNDPRTRLALSQPQPLLNFGLCYGTLSSPPLRTYRDPDVVLELLRANSRVYLQANVRVDVIRHKVVLPEMLRFHWQDFGHDLRSFLLAICTLADGPSEEEEDTGGGGPLEAAVTSVFDGDATWRWAKVEYTSYDWTTAYQLPTR